jgi:hypothetical protein
MLTGDTNVKARPQLDAVYANGTIVVRGANINFNNTSTINVASVANGTQSNIAFSVNVASLTNTNIILNEQFTSTVNQSVFTLNNTLSPSNVNFLLVFRNGLEQAPTVDYTVSGQTLTFTSNTANNDLIEVREFIGMNIANGGFAAGANQQIQFNNNGALAGDANLIYNTANGTLAINANLSCSNVTIGGNYSLQVHGTTGQYAAISLQANNTSLGANDAYIYNYFTAYQLVLGVRNPQANIVLEINGAHALNVDSTRALQAPASPVSNSNTTVMTGLAAYMRATTSCTSSSVFRSESNLTITVNETGVYKYDAGWFMYGSANGAGGFQFTINGGGSATINTGAIAVSSTNNHAYTPGTEAIAGSSLGTIQYATGALATSVTTPDYVWLTGVITVNNSGTIIPQWAQIISTANATNLLANSFVMLTKIG